MKMRFLWGPQNRNPREASPPPTEAAGRRAAGGMNCAEFGAGEGAPCGASSSGQNGSVF